MGGWLPLREITNDKSSSLLGLGTGKSWPLHSADFGFHRPATDQSLELVVTAADRHGGSGPLPGMVIGNHHPATDGRDGWSWWIRAPPWNGL